MYLGCMRMRRQVGINKKFVLVHVVWTILILRSFLNPPVYRPNSEFGLLSRGLAITIGGPTEIRTANLKFPHRGWREKCTVDGTREGDKFIRLTSLSCCSIFQG